MADQLTNILTHDGYADALTLGPAGNVRQLRFTGYSNSFVVQLWKYVSQQGNTNKFTLLPDEYVYAPNTGDVFGPEVAGVRFRSYVPGSPAAIYCVLAYTPDPPAAPTPPFPPSAAPTPGSAYTIIGQGHYTQATHHVPSHLHSSQPCSSIAVHANKTNIGNVYVGNSNSDFSNGYVLAPGDAVAFAVGNAAQVFIDTDNDGDGVSWMAVG